MVTAKENVSVLVALLWVHLAPRSQAEIRRARKSYKETVGRNYGVSDEDLLGGIQGVAAIKESAPLTDEIEELSNQADEEIAALPGDESD